MKTSELIDLALDYSVAKCEGYTPINHSKLATVMVERVNARGVTVPVQVSALRFSTDWSQGGPIIERERISIISQAPQLELWRATNGTRICEEAYSFEINNEVTEEGPTPLIAAMRCYVASKLGDEVEIQEELLK